MNTATATGNSHAECNRRLIGALAVILLAAFLAFFNLWRGPLRNWDEAWYARIALEMAQSGDVWVYRTGGQIDPAIFKPPLCLWAMAAAIKMLGPTYVAVRIFSAACFLATVAAVILFCRRYVNTRVAVLAGVLIACDRQLLLRHCGRSGDCDAALLLFLTLTMFGVCELARGRRAAWTSPVFALALLAKGAAALQILPVAFVWLALTRSWKAASRLAIYVLLATIPLAAWMAVRESRQPGFARGMLARDVVNRSAGAIDGGTTSRLDYVRSFVRSSWPALIAVGLALIALRGRIHTAVHWPTCDRPGRLAWLLALWWAIPFAAFTLAGTHYFWYIYPTYIPAYILFAWLIDAGASALVSHGHTIAARLIVAVLVCAVAATALVRVVRTSESDRQIVAEIDRLMARLLQPDAAPLVIYQPQRDPRIGFEIARAGLAYEAVNDPGTLRERARAGDRVLLKSELQGEVEAAIVAPLGEGLVLPQTKLMLLRVEGNARAALPPAPSRAPHLSRQVRETFDTSITSKPVAMTSAGSASPEVGNTPSPCPWPCVPVVMPSACAPRRFAAPRRAVILVARVHDLKKELRTTLRQTLAAIGADRIHERSGRAARLLFEQPEYQRAEIMMTYLSMPLEVDTNAVVLRAWRDRKRVLAPMVSWENRQMIPVEINSLDEDVVEDPHGIRQPASGSPVPLEQIDLVIVPGLGFDPFGNRLGRGRGFYDRFLGQPSFKGVSCGFALEEQVVGSIPAGPQDVPIHMLVTDVQVRRFAKPHPKS